MQREAIAQAIANLDAWLQTMRQPGGYGGPVVHWWQHRLQYAGPGLDWRYEGILIGYSTLYRKTGQPVWRERLNAAVTDLVDGQRPNGSFRASRFELNPGTLGTPHEAAASLGLLIAAPVLADPSRAVAVATRNLRRLIDALWDGTGFNDRPDSRERVPNKLATLAHALMVAAERTEGESYLPYARSCLEDILRFQEQDRGVFSGAIHQYAPGSTLGDGRFFPYYNARCIPPLVKGSEVFREERFDRAARNILRFLLQSMAEDGSWPQVVYHSGRRAERLRWYAATADMLYAYLILGEPVPDAALTRLLSSQLTSGGFPTAAAFNGQLGRRRPEPPSDARDALPVAGWNDKPLRLLAALLESDTPAATVSDSTVLVSVDGRHATFHETSEHFALTALDAEVYWWRKSEPWARVLDGSLVSR